MTTATAQQTANSSLAINVVSSDVAAVAQSSSAPVPTSAAALRKSPWIGRTSILDAGHGSASAQTRARRADLIFFIVAIEVGASFGLGLEGQPWKDWSSFATAIVAMSRVTAMIGTAFALTALLLSARVPWIEQAVGQDRLVKWHRVLGPYSLFLILAHVLLVTIGFSMLDTASIWTEWWNIVLTMQWMLPALAGFIFMMMIGVTSYRRIRGKLKYETWWAIHLYAYLGIALSFMHELQTGSMFVDQPLLRAWWMGIYAIVFGLILVFRVLVPLVISLRYDFRVEHVEIENHNTISVVLKGRRINSLNAHGGQFFSFRFLTQRFWWESHPYSLSASPRDDRMRITVKDLGDHSAWMRELRPGTRVWIEGPYGVFTADRVTRDRVTLIAAGVGITPIRALLEEMDPGKRIDLIWRASSERDLMLRDEVEALAERHGARVHYLIGSRRQVNLNVRVLRDLVPNIKQSDVFLCGPGAVVEQAVACCRALGVPKQQIHDEAFAY